tara:strand:- start:282 stop:560 length:279 start_codon:yes stop_codon:yes gene_type:complete
MTPEERTELVKDYTWAMVMDLTVDELCTTLAEILEDALADMPEENLLKVIQDKYPELLEDDDDDDDEEEEETTVTVSKPAPPWAPKGFKNQR